MSSQPQHKKQMEAIAKYFDKALDQLQLAVGPRFNVTIVCRNINPEAPGGAHLIFRNDIDEASDEINRPAIIAAIERMEREKHLRIDDGKIIPEH